MCLSCQHKYWQRMVWMVWSTFVLRRFVCNLCLRIQSVYRKSWLYCYHFKDVKYIGFVGQVCFFNLLTTVLLGILIGKYFPNIQDAAVKSYTAKLAAPYWKDFVSGIFCGMLMFLAVDTWKQGQKIGLFIYVPVFIIAGFDHSIANSFYNGAALGEYTFTLNNFWFILIVVAGNAVGGMIFPLLTRSWKKEA